MTSVICPSASYSLVNNPSPPTGYDSLTIVDGFSTVNNVALTLQVKYNPSRTFMASYSLVALDLTPTIIYDTIIQVLDVSFKCDPIVFTWTTSQTSPI